jgi:hypothetical protein
MTLVHAVQLAGQMVLHREQETSSISFSISHLSFSRT